jgi:hypothetical protein
VEAAQVPWRPLGELFVSRGLISEAELETALAEQAATGKRLGEILVERGLVSGPDLTSALMDQLGAEISKEEGFGSGLWAEIKRRHKRVRHEGEEDGEDDGHRSDLSLLLPPESEPETDAEHEHEADHSADTWVEPEHEPEPFTLPPAAFVVVAEPEAVAPEPLEAESFEREFVEPEPAFVAADPELEHELEEIRAEYEPPAPIESFVEPLAETALQPESEFAEPEHEFVLEPEPAPIVAVVSDPEPQPDPAAAAYEPAFEPAEAPVTEHEDASQLRAELDDARAELARLQEMLADAMTALNALTAEAAGKPYTGD